MRWIAALLGLIAVVVLCAAFVGQHMQVGIISVEVKNDKIYLVRESNFTLRYTTTFQCLFDSSGFSGVLSVFLAPIISFAYSVKSNHQTPHQHQPKLYHKIKLWFVNVRFVGFVSC